MPYDIRQELSREESQMLANAHNGEYTCGAVGLSEIAWEYIENDLEQTVILPFLNNEPLRRIQIMERFGIDETSGFHEANKCSEKKRSVLQRKCNKNNEVK